MPRTSRPTPATPPAPKGRRDWRGTVVEGQVKLRGIPHPHLPPPDCALVDPQKPLPLLQLTLCRPSMDGAAVPAGKWRKLKVWLWGVWSDRIYDLVEINDRVRIEGGTWEDDTEAEPGDHAERLALPPKGASIGATIFITGNRLEGDQWKVRARTTLVRSHTPQHPNAPAVHRRAQTLTAEVKEDGLSLSRPPAGSAAASGSGAVNSDAAAAAAGGGKKRARAGDYDYPPIRQLPLQGNGPPGSKGLHLFGVVLEYQLPRATSGSDMKSTLHLIDESCTAPGHELVVNFFKAHPEPPGVGAVVRLHRVEAKGAYDGIRQAQAKWAAGRSLTSWVFGDLRGGGQSNSNTETWLDSDSQRVQQLSAWARRTLAPVDGAGGAGGAFGFRVEPLSLAQAAAAPIADGIDLLVCLGEAGAHASLAASHPQAHGMEGTSTLHYLLVLHDQPCSALGSETLSGIALVLHSSVAPTPAQLLLQHLRAPPVVATAATSVYSGGWVRFRNVNVRRLPDNTPLVVYGARSSAVRLPDYHAFVARRTTDGGGCGGGAPANPLPSQDTISSFSSSGDDPISSFSSSAVSPNPAAAAAAAAGAAASAPFAAAAPADDAASRGAAPLPLVYGAAASTFRPAAAAHPQPGLASAAAWSSSSAAGAAGPSSALRTRCTLQQLELLSVKQVQDRHSLAPCVMRVRARLLRALPSDPLLWTTCEAAPSPSPAGPAGASTAGAPTRRFSYRMVLQLEDTEMQQVWLGALLCAEQAAEFFGGVGLPPTDLRTDPASLGRLQGIVRSLCASNALLELGLVSFRPDPADKSENGVAYRIVQSNLAAPALAAS